MSNEEASPTLRSWLQDCLEALTAAEQQAREAAVACERLRQHQEHESSRLSRIEAWIRRATAKPRPQA